MSSSVKVKSVKDLNEIDAHYYSDFTVSADPDLSRLIQFLQAYISAGDELIPDVSLSIMLDQAVILKNVCLTKLDIHQCKDDILGSSCDIVALLGLAELKRAKKQFHNEGDQAVIEQINRKIQDLSYLRDLILNERGIDIGISQSVVEIT